MNPKRTVLNASTSLNSSPTPLVHTEILRRSTADTPLCVRHLVRIIMYRYTFYKTLKYNNIFGTRCHVDIVPDIYFTYYIIIYSPENVTRIIRHKFNIMTVKVILYVSSFFP